jgi:membrane-bound ClpP family serine protease
MSNEGDTFWVSLSEKFLGLLLIVIGALMLYYTVTTPDLGTFTAFFGVVSIILLIIGVFLMVVRSPQ